MQKLRSSFHNSLHNKNIGSVGGPCRLYLGFFRRKGALTPWLTLVQYEVRRRVIAIGEKGISPRPAYTLMTPISLAACILSNSSSSFKSALYYKSHPRTHEKLR